MIEVHNINIYVVHPLDNITLTRIDTVVSTDKPNRKIRLFWENTSEGHGVILTVEATDKLSSAKANIAAIRSRIQNEFRLLYGAELTLPNLMKRTALAIALRGLRGEFEDHEQWVQPDTIEYEHNYTSRVSRT